MTNSKNAGLILRLLAVLVNGQLFFFLPLVLLLSHFGNATTASDLGVRLGLLATALLTWGIFEVFYSTVTTYWWGGTVGKLLTGLRVVDENGKPMGFRRLFFRHLVGYQFSATLFGLGYWSIAKDPNKQGWHDKTVGSQVIVVQNLWPLALLIFIGLLALNIFLTFSAVNTFTHNQLFNNLINNIPAKPSSI